MSKVERALSDRSDAAVILLAVLTVLLLGSPLHQSMAEGVLGKTFALRAKGRSELIFSDSLGKDAPVSAPDRSDTGDAWEDRFEADPVRLLPPPVVEMSLTSLSISKSAISFVMLDIFSRPFPSSESSMKAL